MLVVTRTYDHLIGTLWQSTLSTAYQVPNKKPQLRANIVITNGKEEIIGMLTTMLQSYDTLTHNKGWNNFMRNIWGDGSATRQRVAVH